MFLIYLTFAIIVMVMGASIAASVAKGSGFDFTFFIENGVFWAFVYFIVVMGCETPSIVFGGFTFFLLYWVIKSIIQKEGWDRFILVYTLNMVVCVSILYYFVTGRSPRKGIRIALNSAARQYPSIEPLVSRCEN
jgi:hypothetical protein